jgi:hypothetical protein
MKIMHKSQKKWTKKNKKMKKILRSKDSKKLKFNVKGDKFNLEHINCSPKPKDDVNAFSCYTGDSIIKLRDRWNARHPDVLINTNDPLEIHKNLNMYLSSVCNKESCWLKQKSHFGELPGNLKDSFAPATPIEWEKNPNEWLSSVDIMKVMKQYEKAYKCFDFIGPSPIDFDKHKLYGECVWEELCKFDLKAEIKKGKYKIGIIYNTDPHYKSGQHWISMFINIKNKKIFFFDSTGDPPPKEVVKFINNVKGQGLKLIPKINFNIDSSEGHEHQKKNSECGVYSLFFIVSMLKDTLSTEYLKTHRIDDESISKFRKIYFNDSL